jgi:hypothetical protein
MMLLTSIRGSIPSCAYTAMLQAACWLNVDVMLPSSVQEGAFARSAAPDTSQGWPDVRGVLGSERIYRSDPEVQGFAPANCRPHWTGSAAATPGHLPWPAALVQCSVDRLYLCGANLELYRPLRQLLSTSYSQTRVCAARRMYVAGRRKRFACVKSSSGHPAIDSHMQNPTDVRSDCLRSGNAFQTCHTGGLDKPNRGTLRRKLCADTDERMTACNYRQADLPATSATCTYKVLNSISRLPHVAKPKSTVQSAETG